MPKLGRIRGMWPIPHEHWWLSGGVAASDCIGAWAGKGAASYAASKSNLNSPGTRDLTESIGAQDWTALVGWKQTAGTYLNAVLASVDIPAFTEIVKFSGAGDVFQGAVCIVRVYSKTSLYPTFDYNENGTYYVGYDSATVTLVLPSMTAGVLAATADGTVGQGYRNGVADGAAFTILEYVGGDILLSVLNTSEYGEVSSLATYYKALTQSQIAAIGAAMP
jgi:hypothetical protein